MIDNKELIKRLRAGFPYVFVRRSVSGTTQSISESLTLGSIGLTRNMIIETQLFSAIGLSGSGANVEHIRLRITGSKDPSFGDNQSLFEHMEQANPQITRLAKIFTSISGVITDLRELSLNDSLYVATLQQTAIPTTDGTLDYSIQIKIRRVFK